MEGGVVIWTSHKDELLQELSDGLKAIENDRPGVSIACVEVAVLDGRRRRVAVCTVSYFLDMLVNDMHKDGDAKSWQTVRHVEVNVI